LPKDKVEAARKIEELQQRTAEQSVTIVRLASEKSVSQREVTNLQTKIAATKLQVEEAKAATPDRYKIVKEGARTWRLDSATGKVCLLLASDADWKNPDTARQSCD